MSYEKPKSNEWQQPVRRDYKMRCCDCGLVHRMDFRILRGRVQFRARRDNRATAAGRRYVNWECQPAQAQPASGAEDKTGG